MFGFIKRFFEQRRRQREIEAIHQEAGRNLQQWRESRERGEDAFCPDCGAVLFFVCPGVTTAEEIRTFAEESAEYSGNKDALNGWIHPGIYCPNGCVEVLEDYV